jgi:putative flippase GtrA
MATAGSPANISLPSLSATVKKYRHFILYFAIGLTGMSLDFIVFFLLTRTAMNYLAANIVSTSAGIINNYFLNYRFNYRARSSFLHGMASFYLIGVAGLAAGTGILFLLSSVLGINKLAAKAVVLAIIPVCQFLLNSKYTFGKNR